MKQAIFLFIFFLFSSFVYSQSKNQIQLLDKFVIAHNLGTEDAISKFIKEAYEPTLYKKIDLKKQIKFYEQIVKEFGPLKNEIYELVEVKPTKLVVQMIKKDESLLNKSIDPTEILMVELDTSEKEANYLTRGLGLGALVCARRQE
jgi:hypothetical protein